MTTAQLGEIASIVRGIAFPKEDKRADPLPGHVACLRTTNVQRTVEWDDLWFVPDKHIKRDEQLVRSGDILISTANSYELVGKVAPVVGIPHKATLGAFISLIRPNERVEPKFLYHQLAWGKTQSRIRETASTTTNISNVSTKKLLTLEIFTPPLEAQREIVAELEKKFSRLDEAVANLQRVKANLKRYKASILKAAVEGRLVETEATLARREGRTYETGEKLLQRVVEERRAKWAGRGKYKEPELPRIEHTFDLPKGWTWATLGHLSLSVKDGPHYSPMYADEGIPFISGGNVRPEGIDFTTTKYITRELHQELSKRCKPEVGDLLYTKGGTTGIARVNTDPREFNVWVHVAVLKLAEPMHRFYVQHALNSQHCYRQAQEYTHGVGNQDLGLTRMVWITVPLPPQAEQARIVAEVDRHLSIIREVEAEVDANLKRAQALRQSTLAKAFGIEGRQI
ncbi:MAG: hypothetical protein RJA34_1788 [Pseudomonadota bacterium]